jgi:nucleoside-diphosphate-sugar epimerase
MPSVEAPRVLIAGCGDLGRRMTRYLGEWRFFGLRRNVAELAAPIEPVPADLSRPESLRVAAGFWDAVVYTATPGEFTPEAYRGTYVDGLRALMAHVESPRWIMVSSTAVYGQDAGEWVDENSPTVPSRFNGEVLLEAERLVTEQAGLAVRFSGIYGPGRDFLIRKVRGGGVRCRRSPPVWTNRIHSEDCAAALAHLVKLDSPASVYVASDRCPAPRWDVLEWLSSRLGVPGPEASDDGDTGQGKRARAERLYSTGFALQYPDYKSGYSELLQCA